MVPRASILVVEDEPDIQELICYHLEREGFVTDKAQTGGDALQAIQYNRYDVVLLDLMLPGLSGTEVLKTIRFEWKLTDLPVIIVSARSDESDIITGLELGADNYLPKPFSPKVLVANVKALLRRSTAPPRANVPEEDGTVTVGKLAINTTRHEVSWNGSAIELTATEFGLMHLFANNPGRVFTRNQLISQLRGDSYPVTERSIDVQIASLRRKLGEGGSTIKTVWGIGYSFQEST
jgi:two-component system phosphate regulon response regulator PhoB